MEREKNLADVWKKVEFVARTTDQNDLPFSLILESHSISFDWRVNVCVKPEPP